MRSPPNVEFLDRKSYRQRRYRDAVRILPLFGVVLMLLPLMWPSGADGQSRFSGNFLYYFGLWFALVAVAFALSRLLTPDQKSDAAPPPTPLAVSPQERPTVPATPPTVAKVEQDDGTPDPPRGGGA